MDPRDKVALITGASRGIGKAIAIRLAREGMHIAINYVKNKELAEKVAELASSYGVRAKAYKADVSKPSEVQAMVKSIIDDFGGIDVLVSNAGIMAKHHSILDIPLEEWEDILRVNLTGAFIVTREVVPVMIKRGGGKIIYMSSVAGKSGGTVGLIMQLQKRD